MATGTTKETAGAAPRTRRTSEQRGATSAARPTLPEEDLDLQGEVMRIAIDAEGLLAREELTSALRSVPGMGGYSADDIERAAGDLIRIGALHAVEDHFLQPTQVARHLLSLPS
jgi:hypothetical protein